MEREYKWRIPADTLTGLAAFLHSHLGRITQNTLRMEAVYYDTPDGFVHRNGAALRIRRENAVSVCCMKRTVRKKGALAEREEYEVHAQTLAEGLRKLPSAGAPEALCAAFAACPLGELARTEFIRNCYTLRITDGTAPFTAEFAVDIGRLGGNASFVPFEELELELKDGDGDAFTAFSEQLQKEYALTPQPLSKLARAIQAAKSTQGGTSE